MTWVRWMDEGCKKNAKIARFYLGTKKKASAQRFEAFALKFGARHFISVVAAKSSSSCLEVAVLSRADSGYEQQCHCAFAV